jgi:ribonuclease HII
MLEISTGTRIDAGVDEAGRGPLAFGVCAAAVVMPPTYGIDINDIKYLEMIKDSKKVTPKRRAMLAEFIKRVAVAYGIGTASADEIDQVNILNATYLAMHRALAEVEAKGTRIEHISVDGDRFKPYMSKITMDWVPFTCEVDGDARVLNIAAASILAKTHRDDEIVELMRAEPDIDDKYGFSKNKGYGTATHMTGLQTYGVCRFHRRSYAPVKNVLRD